MNGHKSTRYLQYSLHLPNNFSSLQHRSNLSKVYLVFERNTPNSKENVSDTQETYEQLVETFIAERMVQTPILQEKLVIGKRAINGIIKHAINYYQGDDTLTEPIEVMGLIIGAQPEKHILYVSRIRPVTHGTPVQVQFKEEHFIHFEKAKINEKRGEFVLGWYHSHPALGVFLSVTDIVTQCHSFQLRNPKSIAIVVDPSLIPSGTKWKKDTEVFNGLSAFRLIDANQGQYSKYYRIPYEIKTLKL